jgi:hypothetical protein
MNRYALAALALAGLLGGANRATAQLFRPGIYPGSQPVVSPYINLLRTNNGVNTFGGNAVNRAVDLYGIVNPQFAFQGALSGLQQQLDVNQQYLTTGIGGTGGVPVTGHATFFLNSSSYFLTNSRGVASGGLLGVGLPGRGGYGAGTGSYGGAAGYGGVGGGLGAGGFGGIGGAGAGLGAGGAGRIR